jgi:hypothetical protein
MTNQEIIVKRLKSLAWRVGMMLVALLAAWGLETINLLDIAPEVKVFAGLILGEVSKYLNTTK